LPVQAGLWFQVICLWTVPSCTWGISWLRSRRTEREADQPVRLNSVPHLVGDGQNMLERDPEVDEE